MNTQTTNMREEPLASADSHTTQASSARDALRIRILAAGTIVLLILLSAIWFTTVTWSRFSGFTGAALTIVPMLVVGSFVPVTVLSFRLRHSLLRVLSVLSATALGLLNFALVAATTCWIVLGVTRLSNLPLDARALAFALFGSAALVTVYGVVNAAWLRVTRITVRLPNLPREWQGKAIALVSDVHIGSIRGGEFVRRLVARLDQLKPTAVFISGDMFDGAKVDLEAVVQPWADLKAPQGAYFVTGNHDEFGDRAPFLAALARTGLHVLRNEKVTVDGLQIVGVHDAETHNPNLFRAVLHRAKIDRSQPSILLAHQPANLDVPSEAGISLQLSGHTHAGQFWPWNWVVSEIYGRFAYGLNRHGGLQVFTSSGAGTWGPPLRVGTRSEVVLIRLEADPGHE